MASSLDGLLYDSENDIAIQDTHGGVPLYSGLPHEFHHWKFRVESRIYTTEAEPDAEKRVQKMKVLGSAILEELRGDALQAAMDVGAQKIIAADGPRVLLEALEASIGNLKGPVSEGTNDRSSESLNREYTSDFSDHNYTVTTS